MQVKIVGPRTKGAILQAIFSLYGNSPDTHNTYKAFIKFNYQCANFINKTNLKPSYVIKDKFATYTPTQRILALAFLSQQCEVGKHVEPYQHIIDIMQTLIEHYKIDTSKPPFTTENFWGV